MIFKPSRQFLKQLYKLPRKKQEKVAHAIEIFADNPDIPALRNHKLKSFKEEIWSISAGGDLRIHYRKVSDNEIIIIFLSVGTHSQLY